jgi:hypothetical protein
MPATAGQGLFEILFDRRQQPRRGTQRLAMIEQRQIAHVNRQWAAGTFLIHHHRDGAALDTFPEANPAATGEARVRKPFQHR